MTEDLDRARIVELFDELSKELSRTRTRAQVYVVGGAAMALAFDTSRFTKDIDVLITSAHGNLVKAAQAVARKSGLPEAWLNEAAVGFLPKRTDTNARSVYYSPYLTVSSASARHLLAMKIQAGRSKDRSDIKLLMKHLEIHSADEALGVYKELFPGQDLSMVARETIEELYEELELERTQLDEGSLIAENR